MMKSGQEEKKKIELELIDNANFDYMIGFISTELFIFMDISINTFWLKVFIWCAPNDLVRTNYLFWG